MKVGVIGAGSAGVAAARVIAQKGVEVTLFSAEKVLPYFRPRLPEFAFEQEPLDNIFMNKLEWYAENGINLRLDSKVKAFTSDFEVCLKDDSREKFDALIVATGGGPAIPSFFSESSGKNAFPLWNYSDALEIRKRVKSSKKMAIIGGGIIGIETALRAENYGLHITIIEKMTHLMSRHFGEKASEIIEMQLRDYNMDLVLNDNVRAIEDTYNDMTMIVMENDMGIFCDFVVLSVGVEFDTAMAAEAGLKTDCRILVNEHLETSSSGIFAAGDIAQFSIPTPCSAKEALQQGKVAGSNVLAYLNNMELQSYEVQPVPVRLKYKNFELYSIGEVPGIDNEEKVLDIQDMKVYRSCVYEKSALAGVQMVGSNKDSMKYQKEFLLGKVWRKLKNTKIY